MGFAINGVQVTSTAAELNTLEGVLSGAGINYYVTKQGNDSNNDGLSWGQAFLTIQNAFDVVTARGAERGRATVFVGPGGYTEDLVTPLNTIAPFGQLIAVNPTPDQSFGATYIVASTASTYSLIVRARGWLIQGFEIGAVASGGCVWLDGGTTDSNAAGTIIRNCIIGGWQAASANGIKITENGAPLTSILNNHFNGIKGKAIYCPDSATDQPRFWTIADNTFVDNVNHIAMNPRGFKEAWIHDNCFMEVGAINTALEQLDNRGGSNCAIGPNNFFSDSYDAAGGYRAGATDDWFGNAGAGGYTAGDPS